MKIFFSFLALCAIVSYIIWFVRTNFPYRRPTREAPKVIIRPGAFVMWKAGGLKGVFKHGPLMVVELHEYTEGERQRVKLKGDHYMPMLEDLVAVYPGECAVHRFVDYEVNDFNVTARCMHCGLFVDKILKQNPGIKLRFECETKFNLSPEFKSPTGLIYRLVK